MIVFHGDLFGTGPRFDRLAGKSTPGIDEGVVAERDGLRAALDIDDGASFRPIVNERIADNLIPVTGKVRTPLRTEKHPLLPASFNRVAGNQIVSVPVADRNADPVALDEVVFGESVFDAPAKKQADLVVAQDIAANHRPL